MVLSDKERQEKIAQLNDQFRREPRRYGKLLVTRGVDAEGETFVVEAIRKVIAYDDFAEDNNPYGERDFGSFHINEKQLLWKIDYYDENMIYGSEDPADPQKTSRVLTIMFAEEY